MAEINIGSMSLDSIKQLQPMGQLNCNPKLSGKSGHDNNIQWGAVAAQLLDLLFSKIKDRDLKLQSADN